VARVLASIRGRFILSVNDVPEMRACFSAFRIDAVDTRYSIAGGKPQDVSEIIVCGPGADDPVCGVPLGLPL
jgi:DNA adenine methylase